MTVRIQNTLTRALEPFVPLRKNEISMYVCGPTVYDDPHLGHLRSAFAFEIIRRVLEAAAGPHGVKFVRNVTDIDDKIIQRAAERGTDWKTIAEKYHAAYLHDTARLGIRPPTHEPKATENLEGMFAIIRRLEEQGFAYSSAGSVYFNVRKFTPYGALSHQKVDEMLANWRGEPGEGKVEAMDFALWKRSKEGEPSWESPWGPGRPGWHSECSAMSARFCGEEFDIHGGGKDLVFPHHENERAQSMACFGGNFARTWIHHGLVTIEGRKMSKSLGNFLTLDAFLEKKFEVDVLKLFFLQSHYSQDVDFTWEKMRSTEVAYRSLTEFMEKAAIDPIHGERADGEELFLEKLQDDFNTPEAVAQLFILLRQGNIELAQGRADNASAIANTIYYLGKKYMTLFTFLQSGIANPALDRILEARLKAKKLKMFHIADQIRAKLGELGLKIEDRKTGSHVVGLQVADIARISPQLDQIASQVEEALK